jgi:hypothetical protein
VLPPRPWLCQGDLFDNIPICLVEQVGDLGIRYRTDPEPGTAVLVTDSCQLDKRTSSAGRVKISRLQFIPVHDLSSADLASDVVVLLRRGALQPPEAIYVNLGSGQEGVAFLGESYWIPASFFVLESRDFTGADDADPADPFHVVATRNGSRALTMDHTESRLLREKLAYYWTNSLLPDDE